MIFDYPEHPRVLDPAAQALLAAFADAQRPTFSEMGHVAAREAYEISNKMFDLPPEVVQEVKDIQIPVNGTQIAARYYVGLGSQETNIPAIIFSHGGGFVVGTLDGYDGLCRYLANQNHCVVISLDYRMGPEHYFPTAPDDVFNAWQWIYQHADELSIDNTKLVGMGDSAGGNLTAQASVRMRDAGMPIAGQVLIYPAVKAVPDTCSHEAYAEGYLLDKATMAWFMRNYLGANPTTIDHRLDLLSAETLTALPPTFFQLAECDPLVDEGIDYANALSLAGNHVKLTIYPGMLHAFYHMGQIFEQTRQAHRDVAQWLKGIFR